jgi:hypothetical protein
MAMAPLADINRNLVAGSFNEADCGHYFEYSHADADDYSPFPDYPHKVYVGGEGIGGEQGYRWARIAETRAYLVMDEDAYGEPVVERWVLKRHRRYTF